MSNSKAWLSKDWAGVAPMCYVCRISHIILKGMYTLGSLGLFNISSFIILFSVIFFIALSVGATFGMNFVLAATLF